MLHKMNVQYVQVVSTCLGLLQPINPYFIYTLLYMHLSRVKAIRLVATTLNPIIFSVLNLSETTQVLVWAW